LKKGGFFVLGSYFPLKEHFRINFPKKNKKKKKIPKENFADFDE
jgi:hypothetical protein